MSLRSYANDCTYSWGREFVNWSENRILKSLDEEFCLSFTFRIIDFPDSKFSNSDGISTDLHSNDTRCSGN